MENCQRGGIALLKTDISARQIAEAVPACFEGWLAQDGRKGYYEYELGEDFYLLARNVSSYEVFLYWKNGGTKNILCMKSLDEKSLKGWVGAIVYVFRKYRFSETNIWQLRAGIEGLQNLITNMNGQKLPVDSFYLQRMFVEFVDGWGQGTEVLI